MRTSSRPGPGESEAKNSTLHVRPVVGGGETITLASMPEGISDLEWSPDGRWLAYASRARTDRYESDDPKKQPPRRITRFFGRLNGDGWVVDRPQHIWVVPLDGSAPPKDLTPGDHQFADPRWSPDSKRLVHLGISNFDAGRAGGEMLAQAIGGKGKVLLGTFPSPAIG